MPFSKGERVLLVDDLIATAARRRLRSKLLQKLGAEVVAACFVIDLPELAGRRRSRGSTCRCGP